jgi:hypothetical protein
MIVGRDTRFLPHGAEIKNQGGRPGFRFAKHAWLSRDVRLELAFEQCDLVFQQEFAFLEALQLQLVLRGALRKAGNDVIKVSVLGVQLMDLGPETIDVGGMYHGVISSIPANSAVPV